MRSCVTSEFNSSEKIHILNRSTLEVATVAHRYLILNFDEAEHTTREVSALQERALQERALQESALQKRSRLRVLQRLRHQSYQTMAATQAQVQEAIAAALEANRAARVAAVSVKLPPQYDR